MSKFNFTEDTSHLKESEQKFLKEKSPEELLKEALESLETSRYNFACFVDSFKRYLIKCKILEK